MRITTGRRQVWLCALLFLIFAGLSGRLYHLQVTKGPIYSRVAFNQRALSLPVASRRGMILDRNGVPLTDPQTAWGVAAFPPLVKDQAGVARALASLLPGVQEHELYQKLSSGTSPFWVASLVDEQRAARVQEMRLPGIAVGAVGERYGENALARHLIGYVYAEGGALGLERALNQELTGEAVPAMVAYLDGTGSAMAGLGIRTVLPTTGKPPYSVHTTIDQEIQRSVEAVLDARRHPDGGPLRGSVVVMDARSGELLAMASRPDFDYKRLGQLLQRPGDFLLNRAVTDYPPGSVFKAIIAAAALESGKVTLDETFYCPGHYQIGSHRFKDAGGAHGTITFGEAIAQSCNVTFLRVGYERLGVEGLREAALRFGFGEATGLLGSGRVWEEQPGLVPGPRDGGAVQIAFGQGSLEVTPLQVARAYAAIANGGILPPLRLVTAIKNPAGEVVDRPAAGEWERVLSKETAAALRQALVGVTDPRGSGTGKQAWVPEVGSAGKTGSAEGVDASGKPAVHAWFAGFVPADAPRYVIVVMVEGGGAGGSVAGPIFREVGQAIMAKAGY